ncbi:MAG: SH3 domain-containing protein [Leptospiraceae bacterium]|nr:SH3 domain-containing protein [Leptospiraceae bacterium]
MKLILLFLLLFNVSCNLPNKDLAIITQPKEEAPKQESQVEVFKLKDIPLGVQPLKEYIENKNDPFTWMYKKLRVEFVKPIQMNDGRKIKLESKFFFNSFDVQITQTIYSKDDFKNNYVFNSKNKMRFSITYSLEKQEEYYGLSYIRNNSTSFEIYYNVHLDKESSTHKNQRVVEIECQRRTPTDYKERVIWKSNVYDLDGKVLSPPERVIDPAPCKLFFIHPFLPLGKYLARTDKVRVREQPNVKAKIVTELSKNTELEVVEDMGKIEEIGEDVSPWARVKLNDGREGFIYGALIKQEGLFWE